MELLMMGLSFRTADMDLMEQVSYKRGKSIEDSLVFLKSQPGIEECVIIATCNRHEAYCYAASHEDGLVALKALFVNFHGINADALKQHFYVKAGIDAVEHLMHVACGLDSMLIGEDQILGQVNDSRKLALDASTCGKVLDRLFREAVAAGKELRATTGISNIPVSISYMAVKLAAQLLNGLGDKTAFVIGTGEMGKSAIRYLTHEGASVYITNRTIQKAMDIAQSLPGVKVVDYDSKYRSIAAADLLISATDAPHYTVYKNKLAEVMTKGRSLLILDLAVPRDIDPGVKDIPGVTLYDMDRFKTMVQDNIRQRQQLSSQAAPIISKAMGRFVKWHNALEAVPIISTISSWADELCHEEMQKIMHKLSSDRDREIIDRTLRRLTDRLLARPITWIKEQGEEGRIGQYKRIIADMFGVEDITG